MAATMDGSKITYADGGINSFKGYIIDSGETFVFTPNTLTTYFILFTTTTSGHAFLKVTSYDIIDLIKTVESGDVTLTVSNYQISLRNNKSWAIPIYILSM